MAGMCVSAHSAYFRVGTAQTLNKGTGQQSPGSESVTHPEADYNPEVLGTTQAGPMLGLGPCLSCWLRPWFYGKTLRDAFSHAGSSPWCELRRLNYPAPQEP